jgi:ankyrin repeat protein
MVYVSKDEVAYDPSILSRKKPFGKILLTYMLSKGTYSDSYRGDEQQQQQQQTELRNKKRMESVVHKGDGVSEAPIFIQALTQMSSLSRKRCAEILSYICKRSTKDTEELANELLRLYNNVNGESETTAAAAVNGTGSSDLKKEISLDINEIRDAQQHSYCTLMHLCAQRNLVKCMELLHNAGAQIDSLDSMSATPLFYACSHNCVGAAMFLLYHGANVNARDSYNGFPLLVALKNKCYEVVEVLQLFHVDIHLKGTKANTCLHTMVDMNDLTSIQFLMEKCGASALRQNGEEENVLFYACGNIDIIRYLCKFYCDKRLTTMMLNKNNRGYSLIHQCCSKGYFDSLLVLLDNMCREDLSDEQIAALLNEPVDSRSPEQGQTPLMLAVRNGHLPIVEFFCQCKEYDVDATDRYGNTALHYAIKQQNKNMIDLLINIGGASIKIKNMEQKTCAQLAQELRVDLTSRVYNVKSGLAG